QWLYYSRTFNDMVYQMPRIFPVGRGVENRVICVSGTGGKLPFRALMSASVPSLHMVDIDGSQCFPRYLFEEAAKPREGELVLGEAADGDLVIRDAITDEGLAHFQAAYPPQAITKDDLFYYVYGLLH